MPLSGNNRPDLPLRLGILSNNIRANRTIARAIGLHEAILLQQLVYQYGYYRDRKELTDIEPTKKNGLSQGEEAVYTTDEFLSQWTCLSKKQIAACRAKLIEMGLIKTYMLKIPPRLHYVINEEKIHELLDTDPANDGTPQPDLEF